MSKRAGKRTRRPERVVCGGRVDGAACVFGGACAWAGEALVVVVPCRSSCSMYAGLTRSVDTMTSRPRTISLNVLSVRATTL
jgi:hypothetical protein